jgi:hypothetical protein
MPKTPQASSGLSGRSIGEELSATVESGSDGERSTEAGKNAAIGKSNS